MRLLRALLIAYWLLLTLLLLVPNPAALFFGHLPGGVTSSYGVHLTAFTLLGLLFGLSRFRASRWMLVAGLVLYGLTVESLQVFFPPRTVELGDYIENVAGIALGTVVAMAIEAAWRRMSRKADAPPQEKAAKGELAP